MKRPIHLSTVILPFLNLISRSPLRRGFHVVFLGLALASFDLPQTALAVNPAPDGGYPNDNTAEGEDSLASLTTGSNNTANGAFALFNITTGNSNTATGTNALEQITTGSNNTANGASALKFNTADNNTATGFEALFTNGAGFDNTANGANALQSNTTGGANTASGVNALLSNTTGNENTANGFGALESNTTGQFNTASGVAALNSNTTGNGNTANGSGALNRNTTGFFNTANGVNALEKNTIGHDNIADGFQALLDSNGSNNIGLGSNAGANLTSGNNNIAVGVNGGLNLTTGSNNIDIGAPGVAGEAGKIRIGKQGTQNGTFIAGIFGVTMTGSPIVVNSSGKLGVSGTSSARFKEAIKPMDKTSEAILALQPVTFRYKHELDPDGIPQFGLVAEQVEKVNPDLVVRDEDGKINTVRYEAVNAMLLNEFLKEHRKVEAQERKVEELEATVAKQQKAIETLSGTVQKIGDRMELSKPAPRVAANEQ